MQRRRAFQHDGRQILVDGPDGHGAQATAADGILHVHLAAVEDQDAPDLAHANDIQTPRRVGRAATRRPSLSRITTRRPSRMSALITRPACSSTTGDCIAAWLLRGVLGGSSEACQRRWPSRADRAWMSPLSSSATKA